MTTPFRELEARALAAMTDAERAEFDAASHEAEIRMQVAELVYTARTDARLDRTALAERAGTEPRTIEAIEVGAEIPSVVLLQRIAHALDRELTIGLASQG